MAKLTEAAQAEQDDAIEKLREILKPGDTLHTVVRHVSRSGMSRSIDVYLLTCDDDGPGRRWLSSLVARAGVGTYDKQREAVRMGGCGMDMGFALVYDLSRRLFPEYDCLSKPDGLMPARNVCPSSEHQGAAGLSLLGPVPGRHRDGYALRHQWL